MDWHSRVEIFTLAKLEFVKSFFCKKSSCVFVMVGFGFTGVHEMKSRVPG